MPWRSLDFLPHRAQSQPRDLEPARAARRVPALTIEHLMASSAIPFLFPATPLWVDGRREFFGDGSVRQVSPLSPAMHLGAHKILVVGVGQPQRSGLAGGAGDAAMREPTLGRHRRPCHGQRISRHAAGRRGAGAARHQNTAAAAPEVAGVLPYRSVEVLSIQPTQSLDALAQASLHELPGRCGGRSVG
jgi:NTE family protein